MRRSHLTRHPVNDVSRSETEDRLGNEHRDGSNEAEDRHDRSSMPPKESPHQLHSTALRFIDL
jgi:hypothetical protein